MPTQNESNFNKLLLDETEGRAAHKRAKAEIEAGFRRAQLVAKLAHVVTGPDGVPARHQTGMRGILSISPG